MGSPFFATAGEIERDTDVTLSAVQQNAPNQANQRTMDSDQQLSAKPRPLMYAYDSNRIVSSDDLKTACRKTSNATADLHH